MGAIDFPVIGSIARRELSSYLGNPAGYVFLTLFIAATGAGAFLQEGFFARNLADLALLNKVMPAILMLFVPAVTMNVWAEERRRGTDELLLTMPVRDIEVVLGKFLGALGVFTVGLAFSLAHVFVLAWLGEPDPGLMVSTYLGYWLVGLAFVSLGLLASMFSANATIAFILGALGCAALVFAGTEPWASAIVGCAAIAGLVTLAWVTVTSSTEGAGYVALGGAVVALIIWLSGSWAGFEDTFGLLGVDRHFYGFGEGIVR
ncbi:MAG: ABC-2 transporter permease, partial [Myxococcales bacterium]|nr:ABC-2 transporter permease [Myxococcales bacterium]